uniref:Sorting nexin-27 n=2 Tax=Ascaris TaxID=6251 RepID=A0A9J2PE06_ASCLU
MGIPAQCCLRECPPEETDGWTRPKIIWEEQYGTGGEGRVLCNSISSISALRLLMVYGMGDESDSSEDYYVVPRRRNYNPKPHLVTIVKSDTGFGFNVKGQVSEGGQLRSINGELYAPLQHVSAVMHHGAAEKAGLLKGDRILQVNGVNVEGATHKQVVELIKEGGDRLVLVVISVDAVDAERFDGGPADENCATYRYDYSEKRSLPITIPSYQTVTANGERFVAYNVHMAGRHLGSRRYSEFVNLHNALKREFVDFDFPKLPSKWPFSLSEQQLDARRRGLELYLEKVCAIRVIADSDIIQEFLMEDSSSECAAADVHIRVLLPDGNSLLLNIKRHCTTKHLYSLVQKRLNMSTEMGECCALFEMTDGNFERKMADDECPHALYIQNYSSAASSCILVRKWLFDTEREIDICKRDSLFKEFCFWQAVADVNSGIVNAKERLYQLKALQSVDRADEYLGMVRQLEGYNRIAFPHCACDSRKGGDVLLSVVFEHLSLRACDINGQLQEDELLIEWSDVLSHKTLDENATFAFEYSRPNKKPKLVKFATQFASYMKFCFERIHYERGLRAPPGPPVQKSVSSDVKEI